MNCAGQILLCLHQMMLLYEEAPGTSETETETEDETVPQHRR